MALTRAYLKAGDFTLTLPVNIYTASWGYQHNTSSTDTIGGRVVQLLSVNVTDLTISSVAGSRRDLQRTADGIRRVMGYHIDTSLPAKFVVPSRAWHFSVYVRAMPQVGWDFAATTYPYQLTMAIFEDLTGVKTRQISDAALKRLADGIGYNPAVHGGNTGAFNDFVDTVLKLAPDVASSSSNSGNTSGTPGNWQGKGDLWQPDVASAPWNGNTIKDQIYNCWDTCFPGEGNNALCIAERESSFQPAVNNHYGSNPVHYVYGLFQISDVHSAASWWPKSGVHGDQGGLMYDAEYNTRSAMQIFKQEGWGPWSTAGGCGL